MDDISGEKKENPPASVIPPAATPGKQSVKPQIASIPEDQLQPDNPRRVSNAPEDQSQPVNPRRVTNAPGDQSQADNPRRVSNPPGDQSQPVNPRRVTNALGDQSQPVNPRRVTNAPGDQSQADNPRRVSNAPEDQSQADNPRRVTNAPGDQLQPVNPRRVTNAPGDQSQPVNPRRVTNAPGDQSQADNPRRVSNAPEDQSQADNPRRVSNAPEDQSQPVNPRRVTNAPGDQLQPENPRRVSNAPGDQSQADNPRRMTNAPGDQSQPDNPRRVTNAPGDQSQAENPRRVSNAPEDQSQPVNPRRVTNAPGDQSQPENPRRVSNAPGDQPQQEPANPRPVSNAPGDQPQQEPANPRRVSNIAGEQTNTNISGATNISGNQPPGEHETRLESQKPGISEKTEDQSQTKTGRKSQLPPAVDGETDGSRRKSQIPAGNDLTNVSGQSQMPPTEGAPEISALVLGGQVVFTRTEITGENGFTTDMSTEFDEERAVLETDTSPFAVSTTDADGQNKHFNSEETASPSEGAATAERTVTDAGNYPSGVEDTSTRIIEQVPIPGLLSFVDEKGTEEESSETGRFEFLMPPKQTYHPEGEEEMEIEEEEGDVYNPYTFPPDEQMGADDMVVKYLYNSEEFSGEVEDYNVGLNQYGEDSPLSVHSLDEMIRLLDGDFAGYNKVPGQDFQGASRERQEFEAEVETKVTPLEQGQGGDDQLVVLGPNHPKMQRFQEALRQHLERQMYQAECETRDGENELKVLRRDREETGQHLYNLQFELSRQSETLGKLESQLDHLYRHLADHEANADIFEVELANAKQNMMREINLEEEMIQSIKEMDIMEWCIRQTDADYEGEAKIQGQLDEQFQRAKAKTEMQKRNQDFYLDKVMTHVQRMEQANSGIQRQIQAHLDEQKDLNTSINEAGTEIEIIQIEKHHLSRAWNETISVVRARDEALRAARETLQFSKEEFRNRESELRSLTRGINKEQERHEEKTILLKRRRMEERIADSQMKALQDHSLQLQTQLNVLHTIKQQVEQDYLKAMNLLSRKEREIHHPRRQLELLSAEKARLEDLILFHMQEHDAVDKVVIGLAKKIQQAREKTRAVDAEVAKVENDMTNLSITVEKFRTDLLKKSTGLEELDKKLKSQEKILQAQAADMKQSEKLIQKKTSEIEHMNRKLKKTIADHGGVETGPLEKEIEDIEKTITSHRSVCIDLQEQWLKLQDELVALTTQRDAILAENELIRKEAFIMERKKHRLDSEVAIKKIATAKIGKQIELLQKDISSLNAKLYDGKEEETQMDRDNILIQNDFISLLKDAETEAVEFQQEIANLEGEKDTLTAILTEGHEQCLWWEKKVKLARELRESIKQEQENSTSGLRLAIHHMQVRYQELMRVQEKLMGDLERSIDRRDRIIQAADHDLKRANVDPNRTRLNIQRNRESIEEKNRQVVREAMEAEKEIKEMQQKIAAFDAKLKCETDALRKIREMIVVADEKISDATVDKHKDLIELFLRQQKYKILESMIMNRYKLANSPEDIDILIQEGEEICYELAELCEILIHQYPDMALSIRLIKASIFSSSK